jgi:hypothetical protein
MRIVFELHGKTPQVNASVDAYHFGAVANPPQWRGSRAEVLIVDCIDWESEDRREGDGIHIEGDTAAIRRALTDVLQLLEANEAVAKEQAEIELARYKRCPSCGTYADAKAEWHGDGHGKACYGLLDERKALVLLEQPASSLLPAQEARDR